MTHRPSDVYGFVATEDIHAPGGIVKAFAKGDAVPESTVEELGLYESGQVVRRDEWEDRPEDETERPMVRGEMPPHLRDKRATDAETDPPADSPVDPPKDEPATVKTVKAGGSSRKTPVVPKETNS